MARRCGANVMNTESLAAIYTDSLLDDLFPPERTDRFFDALFGDAEEGAYDIRLRFLSADSGKNTLFFEFQLLQRPGKCLACNLTHGLPEVFSRHPAINVKKLSEQLATRLGDGKTCASWKLGATRQHSADRYAVPLEIRIQ